MGEKATSRSTRRLTVTLGRRECEAENCGTILSRYNPGRYCASCDHPKDDNLSGRQTRR